MSTKLNLLLGLKVNSITRQTRKLSLSAKIFLGVSFGLMIALIFIVGSGSLKTLRNAEKFQVVKPADTRSIPLPNVSALTNGIASAANSNSSSATHINVSFEEIDLSRGFILSDMGEKISSKFAIPEGKEKAVAFWFDLYTKYSSEEVIIFNKKYPWIIYEIITSKTLKHKITSAEMKFKIDKIKWTLTEMLEKESLTTNDELSLFALYNDSIGFEPAAVKASIESIDYTIGLKETFMAKMAYFSKLIKTIEVIFAKNKVEPEYARIFLTSPYLKLSPEDEEVFSIPLVANLENQFLKQNSVINEAHSPIKVAQILAILIKNLKSKTNLFKDDWIQFNGDLESAFLAALHADEYFQELFSQTKPGKPLPIKAYRLKEKTPLNELVKMSGMSAKRFLEINSDINLGLPPQVLKSAFEDREFLSRFNNLAGKIILPPAYTFFVY